VSDKVFTLIGVYHSRTPLVAVAYATRNSATAVAGLSVGELISFESPGVISRFANRSLVLGLLTGKQIKNWLRQPVSALLAATAGNLRGWTVFVVRLGKYFHQPPL
jgi:hypothetical protein